jgi:hypothetical protein
VPTAHGILPTAHGNIKIKALSADYADYRGFKKGLGKERKVKTERI